jgi:hypothetical protein
LEWKMAIYVMAIWDILRTFGIYLRTLEIFYGHFGIFYENLTHSFRYLVSCSKKNVATLFFRAQNNLPRNRKSEAEKKLFYFQTFFHCSSARNN